MSKLNKTDAGIYITRDGKLLMYDLVTVRDSARREATVWCWFPLEKRGDRDGFATVEVSNPATLDRVKVGNLDDLGRILREHINNKK